jgi:hypothetical protein
LAFPRNVQHGAGNAELQRLLFNPLQKGVHLPPLLEYASVYYRRRMVFNFAALHSRIIFELSCCGIECIADGDINIFMSLVFMALTADNDFFPWRGNVDANMVQIALVMVVMACFHRNSATDDMRVEFIKLADFFLNSCLNRF